MSSQPNLEETIVDAALELPPEERAAYLDQACGPDLRLRQLVEGMLRAHQRIGAARPPANQTILIPKSAFATGAEAAGSCIGPYKLLQQIGEGGYGVVFMAEQQQPVRRRVALKLVKLGMDTKQVIARFEAERQALALMDHPNIAKVLDAGATETGRPFFVMELVRGIRITDYCDQNNLPTTQRLQLFIQVCNAIQHAHQKGIIHRDIKPSNILVTLHDGVAVPKVIDFGIAKATSGQTLTDKTVFTAFEQFIGTPAYMSPEQAEMSGLDIDTRSDLYALGVLLYELLTGKTPFDAKRLVSAALDELRRIIREEEPPRPSARISTLDAAEQTTVAKRRQSEPPKLVHLVRGDLDWIVMKCLEKDRSRRYETVNALASDIQRHLQNEPVMARPPSRLYRLQKTVRRNKVVFAAAAVAILSLVLGLAFSTWSLGKEKQARRLADRQASRSQQIAQLLEVALKGVGPGVALGQDTTLLKGVMDRTVEKVAKELHDQPDLEAELCNTIGEVYRALGLYDKAEAMHRRARALQEGLPRGDQADLAPTTLNDLALVLRDRGNLPEAEALQREVLNLRLRSLGNEHTNVAIAMNNLAVVLRNQGKLAEAEDLHRRALAMQRKLLGNENMAVATCLNNLALTLQEAGKLDEAEASFRQALALFQKFRGPESPAVAIGLDNLATVLSQEGKLDEAEALELRAVAMQKKLLGEEHKDVATALNNLAQILVKKGSFGEAEALHRQVLAMRRKLLGPNHPDVASSLENLALTLRAAASNRAGGRATANSADRLKEAEALERQALGIRQKALGEQNVRVARSIDNLGLILRDEGRVAEAETAFRSSLTMTRQTVGDQHPLLAVTFEHLVDSLAQERKVGDIEAIADQLLTPELARTPQGTRLARARTTALAEAGKEKTSP